MIWGDFVARSNKIKELDLKIFKISDLDMRCEVRGTRRDLKSRLQRDSTEYVSLLSRIYMRGYLLEARLVVKERGTETAPEWGAVTWTDPVTIL